MSLAFRVETLAEVRPEMGALIERQYQASRDDDTPPLDVNWVWYEALEASGNLLIVAARAEGVLVGYVVLIMAPTPHHRAVLMATDDAHYLAPEYRRGWDGVRLIRAAETALRERGVEIMNFHNKNRPDMDKSIIYRRLGYDMVETIWARRLR